jgi:hypothetical protein
MRYILAALAAVLAATDMAAGDPFDDVFTKVDGGRPCYSRTYDAAHLKQHPRQTVARLEIDFDPKNPDGVSNTAAKFELGFGFMLKGSKTWYTNVADCAAKGHAFACAFESDGGLIRLTPQNGALKLDVVNGGGTSAAGDQITTEGDAGFAGFGKPSGDDLSFLLAHAPRKVCDAATQ